MNEVPESIPPPLPPPPDSSGRNGFNPGSWWGQGAACRVLVVGAFLALIMLFLPWDYGFAGQYHTEAAIGSRTSYRYDVASDGSANAFAQHEGWIPLVCLAVILYFCGCSRRDLGGRAWIPFWAAVFLVLCAADAFRTQNRLMDAWLAGFDSDHKPRAQIAAAIYWTFILGVIMAIAAWRHATRRPEVPSPQG